MPKMPKIFKKTLRNLKNSIVSRTENIFLAIPRKKFFLRARTFLCDLRGSIILSLLCPSTQVSKVAGDPQPWAIGLLQSQGIVGDEQTHDIGRPLADLGELGVAIIFFHRKLQGITHAPMD